MVVCFIHVRMEQPVLTYPMATDVTVHQGYDGIFCQNGKAILVYSNFGSCVFACISVIYFILLVNIQLY